MSLPLKSIHLQTLTHPELSLHLSRSNQRRARQVHRFLLDLQHVTNTHLSSPLHLDLYVLSKRDWRNVVPSPYGLSYTSLNKHKGQIFTSVDYPQRLLHQFDSVLLKADFKPPGERNELLDLMLGFEWAYCLLRAKKLNTSFPAMNALLTTYLYLLALEEAGWQSVKDRLCLWTNVSLEPPKQIKACLQTAKSQKLVTERYRLWCFCLQALENTELDFQLFQDLSALRPLGSNIEAETAVLSKYISMYERLIERD